MDQIILKANINECVVENWQTNTGEVNARVMNVEMCEDLCSCAKQFVTFELADGTVYESLVVDGKAKIPLIEKPQFIKIGLYSTDVEGEECKKRYSAHPANVYVNMGGYKDEVGVEPKPTPGDYAELLEDITDIKGSAITTSNIVKVFDENQEYTEEQFYNVDAIHTALGRIVETVVIVINRVNELEEQAVVIDEISTLVGGAK